MRTELGLPDDLGRRRPVPIKGTEHLLPVDQVIEALGETLPPDAESFLHPVELTPQRLIHVKPGTFMTSEAGVFAAGDIVNGGKTVVQAIAEGRDAAAQVHTYLIGS